jgi:hypothetical protein
MDSQGSNPSSAKPTKNRSIYEPFCRRLSQDELETVISRHDLAREGLRRPTLATIDLFVAGWFEHLADARPWHPRADDGGALQH